MAKIHIVDHGSYAQVTFDLDSAAEVSPTLDFALVRGGRASEGGDLTLDPTGLTSVAVYQPDRVDRTSVREERALQLPDDWSLVFVARWDHQVLGVEMSWAQDGRLEQNDLGSSTEVAEHLATIGVPGHATPSPPSAAAFESLTIEGFRGFGLATTLELARPTGASGSGLAVLVGANNGGKSTFLEAIQLLARARYYQEPTFPQPQRHHSVDAVHLVLTRMDGRSLELKTIRAGGSQARVSWLPDPRSGEKFDIFMTPARRAFSPYFGNSGMADREWSVHDEMSRTQLRDSFVGRLKKVDRSPEDREVFDDLLEEIVGYRLNWTFDEMGNGQHFVKLIESDGSWHTSEGLGEGLISLLFIIDALYDSVPGSLIAIDEPELSLHPQLIRRLRRVLSRYAADRQIVIATHSPLLIDWHDVAAGASIARVYKSTGSSALAQVSEETLRAVAALALSGNKNNPHTLGETAKEAFFLEDSILLLEGMEDVTYLPVVLDDLGMHQFDNVYGRGSGGVTNMPLLAQLFLELGFQRIAALVDGDENAGTQAAVGALSSMGPNVVVRQIPADDIRTKRATTARGEKIGLLDTTNEHIRTHLREGARVAITELQAHLKAP